MDINPFPQTDSQRVAYWKQFDRQRWGYLGFGMNRIESAIKEQVQSVSERLEVSISAAIGNIESISTRPMEQAYQDIYGKVGSAFAMQIYNSFKSYDPRTVTKQDEDEFLQYMKEWISVEGAGRVQAVTDTTKKRLRKFLDQAIDEGLGSEEAAKLLSEQSQIIGRKRARVIARTEIISASNKGSIHGARQTNLTLRKEWIHTPDGRVRDGTNSPFDHTSVDPVPIDDPFIVSGEELDYPGDMRASAGNTIQCRCTQGYRQR